MRIDARSFPAVRCPGCPADMIVVVAEAAPEGNSMVTWRCIGCGTEAVRLAKTDDGRSGADSGDVEPPASCRGGS